MLERERVRAGSGNSAASPEPRERGDFVFVTPPVLALAAWQSRDRVVGHVAGWLPGAAGRQSLQPRRGRHREQLRCRPRLASVVLEAPPSAGNCARVALAPSSRTWCGRYRTSGRTGVSRFHVDMRTYSEGYNENNPKMSVVPSIRTTTRRCDRNQPRARFRQRRRRSMTAVHASWPITRQPRSRGDRCRQGLQSDESSGWVKSAVASGNAGVLAAI